MDKETYEVPAVVELGSFGEETGVFGIRNGDEITWFFDTWQ
ncbi:hypothetical protein J2Z21_001126 [Streptomyces griseochromogenes]|uniref:Lasso RiPP family leader peptide-containing protein n=1 Tax=Streptomyces griseochromogenes TaxID=68214 RepID=A0ABS4LLD1_9ACTN|nr:lasso RiPP family leader peptide-containing protein [Streptomyces griseochromogenes]MBP2048202.1 hypothetical protein [Streptomyces griseochromogenes]